MAIGRSDDDARDEGDDASDGDAVRPEIAVGLDWRGIQHLVCFPEKVGQAAAEQLPDFKKLRSRYPNMSRFP